MPANSSEQYLDQEIVVNCVASEQHSPSIGLNERIWLVPAVQGSQTRHPRWHPSLHGRERSPPSSRASACCVPSTIGTTPTLGTFSGSTGISVESGERSPWRSVRPPRPSTSSKSVWMRVERLSPSPTTARRPPSSTRPASPHLSPAMASHGMFTESESPASPTKPLGVETYWTC